MNIRSVELIMAAWLRVLILTILVPIRSFPHDNKFTHPAISESAAKSSLGLRTFLIGYFGMPDLSQPKLSYSDPDGASGSFSPLEWLKKGSEYEDNPTLRGKNHFYDPTKNPAIGLTDSINWWGQVSFKWASESYHDVPPFQNQSSYSWPDARRFQFNALVKPSKTEREENLAKVFFYLGHVMHLNQDLTSPAHVRNDNHIPYLSSENSFEAYGAQHTMNRPAWFQTRPRGWHSWQASGFQM